MLPHNGNTFYFKMKSSYWGNTHSIRNIQYSLKSLLKLVAKTKIPRKHHYDTYCYSSWFSVSNLTQTLKTHYNINIIIH